MSFGWSPSDIVSLARLSYEIYGFCQNAPAELQDLFERLNRIGQKLQRFSTILEKSGLGIWKEAPDLEQHLLDARAYLEPLRSVFHKAASAPSKAKGLARLALKQDKLRRIEKSLDVDERAIDEMKIDLILACSLRSLQYGQDPQMHLFVPEFRPRSTNETTHKLNEILPAPSMASTVPISSEVDRSNHASKTVLNASKALVMAMGLRSQPSWTSEAISVSDDTPEGSFRGVQMDNDFITDIASLAEETELYVKDADPIQNLEHLTEIADRATHFQSTLHLAKDSSSNGTLCEKLPMALEMIPEVLKHDGFGQSYSTTNNPSIRTGAFDGTRPGSSQISAEEHPLPLTQCPAITLPSRLPLRNHSGDEDQITRINIASAVDATIQSSNEVVTNNIIRLRGLSKVSLSMNHKASMSFSFSLEVSEGSVLLRITSNDRPNASFNAVGASGAPSSTTSSPSHRLQSAHNLPRTFQHCFQSRARPIPHMLHPDVEGPSEEPDAPYTISFTERQYIATEGVFEERRWTTSLMYIFHEKKDRTTFCEIIFGKTLVMSAGTNKITYNGQEISHMSPIALWLDDATATKSITLSPNLTGKRTTPKDIELKVHGLWEASKALRVLKTLTIVVDLMPRIDDDFDTFAELDRQSTATSGLTVLSKASATNSQKKTGPFKYNIEFTHVDDRQSFLSSLR